MRRIAVLLCGYALVACASNKSAEPPIENPNEVHNEVHDPMSAESVRQNGAPSPDSDLDGHRDDVGKRADRDRDLDVDNDKAKDEHEAKDKNEPVAADNTGVNDRDEEPGALTPTDQGEGESDLEITQNIRKAVMKNDSLSFTAKNVKIITQTARSRFVVRSRTSKAHGYRRRCEEVRGRSRGQSARSRELRRTVMGKAVMGLVETTQAGRDRSWLICATAGFANNDISVLFPDKSGTQDFAHEHNTKAPEGAVAGHRRGRRHRRHARPARGHRRARDPGPRALHRGRPDHRGAERRGGRRSPRRHHGRADRHGHPRDRGQALRGQDHAAATSSSRCTPRPPRRGRPP